MSWGAADIIVLALAGIVAYIVSERLKAKKARGVLFSVVFFAANAVGREYVVKPQTLEAKLLEVPAFHAIRDRDPDTYRVIRADIVNSMRAGDQSAVEARIRGQAEQLTKRYIARATDSAVRRYLAVTVAEIDQVCKRDPAIGKSFLFPKPGEFVNIRQYLDDATQREDMAAVTDVIQTGAYSPASPIDPESADVLLDTVMRQIAASREDFELLANLSAPHINAAKLCGTVEHVFRRVLALPEHRSAMLVRRLVFRDLSSYRSTRVREADKSSSLGRPICGRASPNGV